MIILEQFFVSNNLVPEASSAPPRVKKENILSFNWIRGSQVLESASLFTKCLFTIFVPLDPPPPNQQSDGFPLVSY